MEFIYEIENALPKEVCEEIIERFLNSDHKIKSGTFGGVNTDVRKSTNLWITTSNGWDDKTTKNIINTFLNGLDKYKKYLIDSKCLTEKTLLNHASTISFESLFVNEMKEGEFYNWHIDDTSKNHALCSRTFTCLLYLNTLQEDQGGCTEFMCGKKVRPEQGKLLIFPSTWTYEHRGAIVTNSGVKYTCGCWIC